MRHKAPGITAKDFHPDALKVVRRLHSQGHEAYLVGGCVRDVLLGRTPKDNDLATSATPRQVRRVFRNSRVIGRRFKLAHVFFGDHIIETATFRCGPYEEADGTEDGLLITDDNAYGTAEQDALRRDFTVNAMFYDAQSNEVIDYAGGLEDLESGLLRTIGEPGVRLREDPVRILRAVKFATRLDFQIAPPLMEAMRANADELEKAAPARLMLEVQRLATSGVSLGAYRMLDDIGALRWTMPELADVVDAEGPDGPGARFLWSMLEALDASVHAGRKLEEGAVLAALLYPLFERETDPERRRDRGAPPDPRAVAAALVAPLSARARIPRREATRARASMRLQPRLVSVLRAKGRRRLPRLRWCLQEFFGDALELLRLRCTAEGRGWDVYEMWEERRRRALGGGPSATPSPAAADGQDHPPRKRRRRRRRSRGPGNPQDGGRGQTPEPKHDSRKGPRPDQSFGAGL